MEPIKFKHPGNEFEKVKLEKIDVQRCVYFGKSAPSKGTSWEIYYICGKYYFSLGDDLLMPPYEGWETDRKTADLYCDIKNPLWKEPQPCVRNWNEE